MLLSGGGKKEEVLSSGYSGKTQAILRDALRKADAGVKKPPVTFKDGEDKAPQSFYVEGPEAVVTWVTHSKSEDAMVVRAQVEAKGPLTSPLPDLRGVPKNMASVLGAIRRHQDAVILDMVQREAGREGARRQLLEREIIAWRREQMEKSFNAQRTQAHEHLKETMAAFEKEMETFKAKYKREGAIAQRSDEITARKAAGVKAAAIAAAAAAEEEDGH